MVKILKSLIVLTLIVLSITVSASAGIASLPDDFVGENEFTVASIHEMRQFADNLKNPDAVEDAFYAIADLKDPLNIKYVSMLGEMAGTSVWNYSTTFQVGKKNDEVIEMSENDDKGWDREYDLIFNSAKTITSEGIPYGITVDNTEFYAQGQIRNNRVPVNFPLEKRMPDGVEYHYYDEENFYVVNYNNGIPYMIFQLQIHPVEEVLNWFNSVMTENQDKRAIVYTNSFLDNKGEMYTMWDWADYSHTLIYPEMKLGKTTLCGYAANNGVKPRDGDQLWNYAFANYDNVLAVISSKGITTNEILTTVLENPNGCETLAIGANPVETYNVEYNKPAILLTKFSNDGAITTCYYIPGEGYIEESLKTVKLENLGELDEPNLSSSLPKIDYQYNGANSSYILGYAGNLFKPNANMTRAEACTIFARLILKTNEIPTKYKTRFTDVKTSDWFYGAVAFLDESGFFYRNTSTTYKPNEPITRAEFVELAYNAANLAEDDITLNFTDVSEDHFYYTSIMAAAKSGLVNGYEDNTFRPDKTITRAEVVTVINRLLGLRVSERTVSPDRLENTFKDIDTHWARLNILMASNSNVHGEYYYEAGLDGIVETEDSYVFANKYIEITVSKKDGKVTSLKNLDDGGKPINANATNPQFIYLLSSTGSKVLVQSMQTEGNRIKITFKNKAVVYLLVDVKDEYMTFEIDSELPKKYGSGVVFSNLMSNITTSKDNPDTYRIGLWGMTWWTIPSCDAMSIQKNVSASAYNNIGDQGTMGAKAGLVLAKMEESFEIFKDVSNATDRSVGLASTVGGPFADSNEANFEDYVIVFNLSQDNLDNYIDMAVKYDMDVLDLHQSQTFYNGSFYFGNTSDGTAKAFNKEYMTKIKDAGLNAALHTYAFFLDDICTDMVSDPKWQKDIQRCPDVYTLDRNITKNRRNIPTVEDASGFDTWVQFDHYNTAYVLIDEEIIEVKVTSSEGFLQVVRGVCGTTAVPHSKGAKIEHLMGRFSMLSPVYGSDLFWEIADRTAKAYNDGGFTMIYMDAIDGFRSYPMSDAEREYWYNAFVHRILSQCHDDPIVEFSSQSTQMFNVRGRSGAIDTFNRGLKTAIQQHRSNNLAVKTGPYTHTLGWFDFMPDMNPTGGMKNTIQKTIFRDDLDVLGTESVAFNFTMVYNNISPEMIAENPFYQDNLNYYVQYSKIRKSNYFTEETREKVQEMLKAGKEFKIIEKSEGEYAFLEMYYSRNNVGNGVGDPLTFSVKNPFEQQKPFIRIEQRYSSLFEDPVTMIDLDETKAIKDQTFPKTIDSFNMSEHMVIKVNIMGTGKDGDALVIDLVDGFSAVQRYFVDLNYTGWKEHVLLDGDQHDWDKTKYTFPGVALTYQENRVTPTFGAIKKANVRVATENSKNAIVGDIICYKQSDVTVTNPSVTVGGQTMTFNTTLLAGEYIEYDPATDTAIRYTREQTKETVEFTGSIKLSSGSASGSYEVESSTVPTVRAKVVFGFAGDEVTN